MSNFKTRINQLAQSFAAGVLNALRSTSLEEILTESGRGAPRSASGRAAQRARSSPKAVKATSSRARRSAGDLERVAQLVVDALKKSGQGMRSEQLQKALKLSKREIVRPIAHALEAKTIRKTGERRATTYFAK